MGIISRYTEHRRDKMLLTADAVIFTIKENNLMILLIKRGKNPFKEMYALPGGFANSNETSEQGCLRELKEETGIQNIFLKKLFVYDAINRDPRDRVITVSFLALIDYQRFKVEANTDAMEAQWFDVSALPPLAFDHSQIIQDALNELKYEIQVSNIAYQVLPQKFTLTHMQKAYEAILNTILDKRNFRKKIKELGILKSLNESIMEGAHRPAQLFRFSDKKYIFLKEKMNVFLK